AAGRRRRGNRRALRHARERATGAARAVVPVGRAAARTAGLTHERAPAGAVPRPRQPDERRVAEPLDARLGGARARSAAPARRAGDLRSLVSPGHRRNGDGGATHDPRLWRLPTRVVRGALPRVRGYATRRPRAGAARTAVGVCRSILGTRSRHLVGVAPRIPAGRRPDSAVEYR